MIYNTKSIVLDIDDTVGNLKERLQEIYRRATGNQEIKYTDWSDYNAKDRYGITSDQLSQLFIEDNSLALMKPHDGLIEVTAILKARGYNVEFVTARGWCPDAYDITKKWLDDHYVSYDRINIVPLFECKERVTRHIENIALFVDDRYDHCTAMMNSGRVKHTLLYSQPWNKIWHNALTPNFDVIDNLYDVLNYLPE
jgi:uncharacterized HAD superfamily protein